MKGIFIAGTDTDVGKTFVSALMAQALTSMDVDTYYYKPVASGGTVDIDTVRSLGNLDISKSDCPIVFDTPCSPHLASEIENRPIDKDVVINHCSSIIREKNFTIVEGAGGTIVPINRSGFDLHDLMSELQLPVVLVTKTGVGTINHTLLTLEFMKMKKIEVAGIVFNGFENGQFERDNIKLLKERTGLPVIGVVPKIEKTPTAERMAQLAQTHLVEGLQGLFQEAL